MVHTSAMMTSSGPPLDRNYTPAVSSVRRARYVALAVVAAALAYATPVAESGWNQNSHYALVASLDRGTARIDQYRYLTGDVAWFKGHFYSNKAPGLALASLPAYATLEATGATSMISNRTSTREEAARVSIWALHLWAIVIPALILLLLVRWVAERVEPGLGTATALTLGLGTLVLPFATLFFAHVLSACLGFAAFALLSREREIGQRPGLLFGGGLLVGFAVTVEYTLAIVGFGLALYGLVGRAGIARRALAYGAGVALGVAPLLLYNGLAFGSLRHLSYADAVILPARSGYAVSAVDTTDFFGWPSPRVAAQLLFSSRGLLTLAPVLALSVVGLVVLYRRGWRAEALLISFVALAFLVFNAGYPWPFGGWSPGPRLLLPALPFVAMPLASVYRRYPACTLGLAAASIVMLATATATFPMLPDDGDTARWFSLVRAGDFEDTVASFAGAHGWLGALPFLLSVVAALAFGLLATPRLTIERRDVWTALLLLLTWGLVASIFPRVGHSPPGRGAIVMIGCAAGVAALAVAMAAFSTVRVRSADTAAPVGQA